VMPLLYQNSSYLTYHTVLLRQKLSGFSGVKPLGPIGYRQPLLSRQHCGVGERLTLPHSHSLFFSSYSPTALPSINKGK
jgi:hypothetical protein